MVFPNFFITFVKHSFHTSHPCTSPSRERRHRPAPRLPPGTTLPSWHTRCTSQKAMLTRHAHATHPRLSQHTRPHTTTPAKSYAHAPHTRYAPTPSQHTRPPCYHPLARAMPHTRPTRKMLQCFPLQPLLSEKKARAP